MQDIPRTLAGVPEPIQEVFDKVEAFHHVTTGLQSVVLQEK
jgi:hypothetical protein